MTSVCMASVSPPDPAELADLGVLAAVGLVISLAVNLSLVPVLAVGFALFKITDYDLGGNPKTISGIFHGWANNACPGNGH